MKNKGLLNLAIFAIFTASILTSCCTKKECSKGSYQGIPIAFQEFTDSQLDSVYSGLINLGNDSVYLKEYDLASRQLIRSSLLTQPYIYLGTDYVIRSTDSFYLNQRYFILTKPGETDTINNISYQIHKYEFNCNNCPGEHDYGTNVVNFKYTYKGQVLTYTDTIFINR